MPLQGATRGAPRRAMDMILSHTKVLSEGAVVDMVLETRKQMQGGAGHQGGISRPHVTMLGVQAWAQQNASFGVGIPVPDLGILC